MMWAHSVPRRPGGPGNSSILPAVPVPNCKVRPARFTVPVPNYQLPPLSSPIKPPQLVLMVQMMMMRTLIVLHSDPTT